MGLVDYSESESSGSDAEAPTKAPAKTAQSNQKRAFQKVVDRSNPGKIVVNLPQTTGSTSGASTDEPPAKRARSAGGGLFSGFSSFLPPPKNANKPAAKPLAAKTQPGVGLRTGAAPGFSRETGGADATEDGGLSLPPPSKHAEPSIPEGQKPADEVKLVGKPLMFKPLSVARNPAKKKKTVAPGAVTVTKASPTPQGAQGDSTAAPAPPPKKVSLFSLHTEEPSEPSEPTAAANPDSGYQPMFAAEEVTASYPDGLDGYAEYANAGHAPTTTPDNASLDTIANDLNLSAAERRQLFGRGGSGQAAQKIVNFNMDTEYQHNEEIRAAGEQQIHNPVRAISSGKHSLQQLVANARGQREALEESFAQGKSNRREASSKYGW